MKEEEKEDCLRWMADVVADLKVMKIKQWMQKTNDKTTVETGC
jgi:hypothetical protein